LRPDAVSEYNLTMICILFPDEAAQGRALGFLAGRYSFKSFATGEMLVAEHALAALAREGIPYQVQGPATYGQVIAAFRNPPAEAV